MKNIFNHAVTTEVINRIDKLSASSQPLWGNMSVDKMLAHCNVSYEMAFENTHPKPNGFMRFILKALVKNTVVNDKPYKNNSQTGPAFIIKDDKNFLIEKNRLIDYILKTQQLGESYFDQKESLSFGKLSKKEWNNMFFKHIDHHLNQFGV